MNSTLLANPNDLDSKFDQNMAVLSKNDQIAQLTSSKLCIMTQSGFHKTMEFNTLLNSELNE